MTAYETLMSDVRTTTALSGIAGRLGWDQETVMPAGSAPQRAEEMAAMEAILHSRRTDPKIADLLATAKTQETGEVEKAQLHHIQFAYDRAVKVPADLATELAHLRSTSQRIWADARAKNDFKAVAPTLKEVIKLSRVLADALDDGNGRYEALLAE